MLNSIIKTMLKLAVLLALVRFVIIPMIPGFNFPSLPPFPSPMDIFKNPAEFGKQLVAQFDPRNFVPTKLPTPDVGQAGRDADQERLRLQRQLAPPGFNR